VNQRQKTLILVGASAIVGMLLYPPFRFINYRGIELNLGYDWLFSPPRVGDNYFGHVNVALLAAQWIAVCVICGALFLIFKSPASGDSAPLPTLADSPVLPSRPGVVIALLRIIRGVAGVVALYQLIGIWPVFTWLGNLSAVNAGLWAMLLIKIGIFAALIGAFFALRWLINVIHVKRLKVPHPALERPWNL
jgi:hypothetical protein